MSTINHNTIRPPRFAKELLKWAELIVKFLSGPIFPNGVGVTGDLDVGGDVNVNGSLDVDTDLNVDGDAQIIGDTIMGGSLDIGEDLQVDGDAQIDGDIGWFATGGLFADDAAISVAWAGGEANDWKDLITLTVNGENVRATENGTTGEITVENAGLYNISFSISGAASAGLTLHSKIAIKPVGGAYARDGRSACRRDISAGGKFGDFGATPMKIRLAAGDTVKLQLQSDTSSRTVTIDHVQFDVTRVYN